MYKYPHTTKAEMVAAIQKLAQRAAHVPINQTSLNVSVGILQSLASHLPETEALSALDSKVALILKEQLAMGLEDYLLSEETEDIEEWTHIVLISGMHPNSGEND